MPSRRVMQVASALQREISRIVLGEVKDPRVGFVTITRVEPDADLRHAKVYFSVLGDRKAESLTIYGLQRAAHYIRVRVGRRLEMRYTPELEFVVDQSVKGALRVSELLEEDRREHPRLDEGPAAGEEAAGDE